MSSDRQPVQMKESPMTLEFWNTIFQWGAVGLVALTFVFVAGAVWTSNLINERQAARVATLESDVARLSSFGGQPRAAAPPPAAPPAAPARPPRTLEATARAQLLDALRRVKPEGPIEIRFVSGGSNEAAAFARALADVIEEAGWPIGGDSTGAPIGEPPVGLLVRISDREPIPARAEALERALSQAGLDARVERLPAIGDGTVELMIGLQP
jgi:hypothetical protein